MAKGILYLIPVPLADSAVAAVAPPNLKSLVARLTIFIVENAKTARQWLKWYGHPTELRQLSIFELKQSDGTVELDGYLAPLLEGKNIGLMSEAGCPGIADPGANVVRAAHRAGIRVVPMVGPSSILLALMASGMNGQRFSFQGYLPVDRNERAKAIAELEQRSRRDHETQIFIETPYRNSALFQALIDTCRGETLLCLATEVTGENETIATHSIVEWRKSIPNLEKRPTVFLLLGKK
jgi:16S rRNA (cytidine1402-2'-O)-methyltransferase